jgi:ketosteroid isomerase-like protein
MTHLLFSIILLFNLQEPTGPEQIIKDKLELQTECWNKGDIDCYMEAAYWKSDDLQFIGNNGITYGWKRTLQHYKAGYPTQKEMGQLKFNILSIEMISEDAYFVVGQYHLTREIDDDEGYFSLLWRKIDGDWVIVADHSSN